MPVLSKQQTTARISAFEQTPMAFILRQSAYLWLLPIAFMCIWLSIPLTNPNIPGSPTNVGLFLFWRALYHQGTCGFVISLCCIAMPTPSFRSQVLLCAVAISCSLAVDYGFTRVHSQGDRTQLFKLVPLITSTIGLVGLYFATKSAFEREMKTYLRMSMDNSSRRQLPELHASFLEHEQSQANDDINSTVPSAASSTTTSPTASFGNSNNASFIHWDDSTRHAVNDSTRGVPAASKGEEPMKNVAKITEAGGDLGAAKMADSDMSEKRLAAPIDPNSLQRRIDAKQYSLAETERVMERAMESDVTLLRRDKDGQLFLVYYSLEDLQRSWLWRVVYTLPIVASYCVCIYYGPLTRKVLGLEQETDPSRRMQEPAQQVDPFLNVLSVLLFALALFPLRILLNQIGKRLDATLMRVQGIPKFAQVGSWICLCYEQFFIRQLFFRTTDVWVVVLVVCINLFKLYMLFPFRMSDTYMEFKHWVMRRVCGLERPRLTDEEKDVVRRNETVIFYFVCMAERMSITLLLVCATMLHFCNYNALSFSTTAQGDYEKIIANCFYMLAIEWTGSTIMTYILIRKYQLNALTFGGHVMCNPHVKVCCIYIAAHIASDYYAGSCITNFV